MPSIKTKINRQDLKIFSSERLTDNDDGGGMPLGTPLLGTPNELFNPISSIERVNGSFHARLEYMGVQRADDEPLIGAYAAITQPPKDPTVSYLLFPATRFGESRAEILKRIEAYNVGTIESRMTLLSTQSQNSRVIQAYQRVGEVLPLVGDVYCLRQNKAGYPLVEQYVQVTAVKSEDRTFTSPQNKDFVRTVVQMEISAKLKTDFIGVEYPSETYGDAPCKIRETAVADAAQYYGVKPLVAAIAKETAKIQITSLMEKIVPTNQVETALIDLTAAGQRQTLFDGALVGDDGVVMLTVNKNHSVGNVTSLFLGNAATPNSVVINSNAGQISDKGGNLLLGDKVIGTVAYERGEAIINEPTFAGWINTLKFRPAASELKVADTTRIPITINNRGYNYTLNLNPAPAVGTLMVSYLAQGRWYDLRDDGSGALRGASAAYGSGNVNFTTGSINISCGEMPDIGSYILLNWGTKANYFNRSGGQAIFEVVFNLTTNYLPVALVIKFVDDNNNEQTVVSDAVGNLTGALEGNYDASAKKIRIRKANVPISGRPDFIIQAADTKTVAKNNYQVTGTQVNVITEGFIQGGMSFHWTSEGFDSSGQRVIRQYQTFFDDGNGKIKDGSGKVKGSIDYDSHIATFDTADTWIDKQAVFELFLKPELVGKPDIDLKDTSNFRNVLTGYAEKTVVAHIDKTYPIEIIGLNSQATTNTEVLTPTHVEIDLLPYFNEVITPASVHINLGNKAYYDTNGMINTDLNPTTGNATNVGTINYQTGVMQLTQWDWTTLGSAVVTSLVTSVKGNPVDAATFRMPTSPIRAGSLQIRATATDGTLVSITSDAHGQLLQNMTTFSGLVNYKYGVADVQFNKHVFAETITYNAVAYSYLPIDSGVVKIDTVRLPQDGRVPIFRRGDTILISNRQVDNIGSAFTGGQTMTLSRKDVDRICVNDADGKPVLATLWDYDLDNGTITWASPLDLSAYKMPLSVTHVQEERNRILQADIDGTLTLIFPTKRAYPLIDTYVSSVLIGGDLQVRVSVPFTQKAWKNIWQDMPDGDQLLNKLNLKDYPMLLTDDGAITDRWMIKWLSGSQFELYSEALGFVGKYDTLTDLAPINPATNKPYFTIPKQAFGNLAPWGTQDIIRFNTWGTLMPVWVLCAAQPTATVPEGEDGFIQCLYGDTTEA